MNTLKKITALMLALALVMVCSVTAMAAEEPDYTIAIRNENSNVSINGSTFSAYRIFEATYDPVLDKIAYQYDPATCLPVVYNGLSGRNLIKWLSETNSNKELIRSDEEMRIFADYVYENYVLPGTATPATTTIADGETAVLAPDRPGYYLVYGGGSAESGNGSITAAVSLDTNIRNALVKPKFKAPTLEKVIFHDDKNGTGDWDRVGDFQVGDTVKFRLTATMPRLDGYSSYKYIVYDTMSPGITPAYSTVDDFTVWIDGYGKEKLPSEYMTLEMGTQDGNSTFSLTIDVFRAITEGKLTSDSILYIYYQGVLNSKAITKVDEPEFNCARICYSNNPYAENETELTAISVVYAWTYDLDILKVDGENPAQKLTGAQFVLSKNANLDITDLKIGTDGNPTVTGELLSLVKTGDSYRIAEAGDIETTYVIHAGSATIAGLNDQVDYYLYEIKSPAGYNLREEPVQLCITTEYSATGEAIASGYPQLTVTDGDTSTTSASMATAIYNEAGVQLPITGGIGTKLFYAIGGILVIGAAVLLITRKRMSMD